MAIGFALSAWQAPCAITTKMLPELQYRHVHQFRRPDLDEWA